MSRDYLFLYNKLVKKVVVFIFITFGILNFIFPTLTKAQNDKQIIPVQEFKKGIITKILEDKIIEVYDSKQPYQKVMVRIEGEKDDKTIEYGKQTKLRIDQKVSAGDRVVLYRGGFSTKGGLASGQNDQVSDYQIIDKYRLDSITYFAVAFFILIIAIGRLKGLGSILGLGISFLVIMKFIVPRILGGSDPVLISIIGSSIIIFTSIYFSHGFSKKTSVAIAATVISLIITGLLASFAIYFTNLTGMGNELASGFILNPILASLNLKGILLGAMIIGTLGVLDDVTTTQSSTIFELKKANPSSSFASLVKSGFNVGRDHISAVVNTLALAYAGVALPLLIFFVLNPSQQPLWLMLNDESLAEEIVRTLAGSFGLVLAVPITTIMAAYFASRTKKYTA